MQLNINNIPYETASTTLAQLAQERSLPDSGVAIAVNNRMVPRTQWSEFAILDGQQITILKAFSGG